MNCTKNFFTYLKIQCSLHNFVREHFFVTRIITELKSFEKSQQFVIVHNIENFKRLAQPFCTFILQPKHCRMSALLQCDARIRVTCLHHELEFAAR